MRPRRDAGSIRRPGRHLPLDRTGAIWCWGEDSAWQTGRRRAEDPQRASRIDPAKVGLVDEHARAITVGFDRSCALRDDGLVNCWTVPRSREPQGELLELFGTGSGAFDQLRIEDFTMTALDTLGGLTHWESLDDEERGRLGDPMLGGGLAEQRIVAFDDQCAADASGNLSCWGWKRDEDTNSIEFVRARIGEELGEVVDLAGACVVGADGLVRCPDGDLGRRWSAAA